MSTSFSESLRRTSTRIADGVEMSRTNSAQTADGYYGNMDGASPGEKRKKLHDLRIRAVRESARAQRFPSILYAGLADAEDSPETIRNFVNSGGYERLGVLARKVRRQTPEYRDKLCATAQSIYSKEWKKLTRENMFKTPLKSFSPASVSSFSISGLFESFQQIAPCFLKLLNHLVSLKRNKPAPAATESNPINQLPSDSESEDDEYEDLEEEKDADEDEYELDEDEGGEQGMKDVEDEEEGGVRVTFTKAQRKIRKRQRGIVVAVSVLANETTNHFNAIQAIIGFLLYASKVPKRTIAILNHLGMSVSYSGIRDAVRANGKALKNRLRQFGTFGKAFWWSYDNCTMSQHVRDDMLHHKTTYETATAGYSVLPPESQARPMFTHDDRHYDCVGDLSVQDILPDASDHDHMAAARRVLIYDVVRDYAKRAGVKNVPNLGYEMPTIHQLDPHERPEIIGLPVKNLDEGQINETIQILYEYQRDTGLSVEQVQNNVINVKGDFATVRNARFFVFEKANEQAGGDQAI